VSSAFALASSPEQQGLAFFILLRGDFACREASLQDGPGASVLPADRCAAQRDEQRADQDDPEQPPPACVPTM